MGPSIFQLTPETQRVIIKRLLNNKTPKQLKTIWEESAVEILEKKIKYHSKIYKKATTTKLRLVLLVL